VGEALKGIRVLECGSAVSAAFCARLLADFGAEVIKVEPPGGDALRNYGPFPGDQPHPERSALFAFLNAGKQSVTLESGSRADREVMAALAARADVLVTSLSSTECAQWGLDLDAARQANPGLVSMALSPLGERGPLAQHRAYEINVCALAGASVILGEPSRPPLSFPFHLPALQAGLHAAAATLAALLARRRCGRGQRVEVAEADVLAFYTGGMSLYILGSGGKWRRRGLDTHGAIYPSGFYPCNDGYIFIATQTRAQWTGFLRLMGDPDWAQREPALRDGVAIGWKRADEVDIEFIPWLTQFTRRELVELAREANLVLGAINTVDDVLSDAHLEARGFWADIDLDGGALRLPGMGYTMSATPWRIGQPPRLGQHTASVRRQCEGRPLQTENKLPSPMPLPAWERVRVRATGQVPSGTFEGEGQLLAGSCRTASSPVSTSANGGGQEGAEFCSVLLTQDTSPQPPRHTDDPSTPRRPLAGYRAIEFGWNWAGPLVGQILADLGVEVIKVETRERLDFMRHWTHTRGFFHNANRGKLSVSVNIKRPGGVDLIHRLASRADIVLDNFAAGVMTRNQLGYEQLRAVKPDIIVLSMAMAGQHGPLQHLRGFATIATGFAGLEAMIGYPDTGPTGFQLLGLGDANAAIQGVVAALTALWHREHTAEGQFIDLSQIEAATTLVAEPLSDLQLNGRVAGPQANLHPSMAPHGTYPAAGPNRWIALAVADDAAWSALVDVMGGPAWARDPLLATRATRHRRRTELDQHLAEWTAGFDRDLLVERLQHAGIAAAAVLEIDEVQTHPHFQDRELCQEVECFEGEPALVYNTPWHLSTTPRGVDRPSPKIGEHNDYVFGKLLGMPAAAIDGLVAQRILW
jgi:crotonobetainyl-CoA:carnitine CoA-transferase CaiB-like acyl-CoA transferase